MKAQPSGEVHVQGVDDAGLGWRGNGRSSQVYSDLHSSQVKARPAEAVNVTPASNFRNWPGGIVLDSYNVSCSQSPQNADEEHENPGVYYSERARDGGQSYRGLMMMYEEEGEDEMLPTSGSFVLVNRYDCPSYTLRLKGASQASLYQNSMDGQPDENIGLPDRYSSG